METSATAKAYSQVIASPCEDGHKNREKDCDKEGHESTNE